MYELCFLVRLFVLKAKSSNDQHPMRHSDSGDVSYHDANDDDGDDSDSDVTFSPAAVTAVTAPVLVALRRASWKQVSPSARRLPRIPVHYSYFPYMSSFLPSAVAKSHELR